MPALGTILTTDNIDASGIGCKVTLQTNQTFNNDSGLAGSNATLKFTGIGTEIWKDVAAMHDYSLNTQRLVTTVASATARWNVQGSVVWAAQAGAPVGARVVYVDHAQPTPILTVTPINRVVALTTADQGFNTAIDFNFDIIAPAADNYFQIRCAQNSNAALDVLAITNGTNCTWFEITRIG
jgi:hypothetical protein